MPKLGIVMKELSEVLPSLQMLKTEHAAKKNKPTFCEQAVEEERWRVEMPESEKKTEENAKAEPHVTETAAVNNSNEAKVCTMNLDELMMWKEILGEPLSKKRRKKRMEQRYANQGYAHRG